MNKKVFDAQLKAIGDREFRAVASDESIDRDGDILTLDCWDVSNFEKNSVILWAHRQDQPPIARAKRIFKDTVARKLMVDVEFPPAGTYGFADTLCRLVKSGYMHSLSVGFLGKKFEALPSGGRKYLQAELLEISLVNLPSNSNAIIQARSKGIINDRELQLLQGGSADVASILQKLDVLKAKIAKLEEIDISKIPYALSKSRDIDLVSIPAWKPKSQEINLEEIEFPLELKYPDIAAELERMYVPNREARAAYNRWKDWKPEDNRYLLELDLGGGVKSRLNAQESAKLIGQLMCEELKKVRGY